MAVVSWKHDAGWRHSSGRTCRTTVLMCAGVFMRGAKVIHSGVVGGDALNDGGRLYIESMARILGDLDTIGGETRDERPAPTIPD